MSLDVLDRIETPAQTLMRLQPRPWKHASVSQITTHGRCARRWWLGKVGGLEEPSSPALELGKQVHAELEAYLLHGTQPGPIASAGLQYLPQPPLDPFYVERAFALYGLAVPLVGAIDLHWREPLTWVVLDHKTVSDSRYAKTSDQLATDTQAIVYGAAVQCFKSADEPVQLRDVTYEPRHLSRRAITTPVEFSHVTYLTRGAPKSAKVSAVLKPEAIVTGMEGVASTLRTMAAEAAKPRPDDVTPDPSNCRSFGKLCPFRGLCDLLGDAEMISNPFARKTADVAAVNAVAQAELVPPPPPEPPAPVVNPSLFLLEQYARRAQGGGFNRNAARPSTSAAVSYPGHAAPAADAVEIALCNVFGRYAVLGDATFALAEHRRIRTPWGPRSVEEWHAWVASHTAQGVPVPSLHDVACYVLDGSARAEERGYKEPPYVPEETLPAMSSEDKAGLMAPAPPAPKPPKKAKDLIPTHDAIPASWHGVPRSQLSSQLAPRCRNELAIAARDAGHDVNPGAADTTVKGLRAEIARLVELLTGALPWGDADESAEAPPPPPVPSSNAAATAAPPAPPVPAPLSPSPPPEPPASSDVAGGASPPSVLYVDCMPVGVRCHELGEWLVQFEEAACLALDVEHYSLAKYKEGDRRVVSEVFRGLRNDTATIPRALMASSRHPLFDLVLPVIRDRFDVLVQAVR